MKKKLKAAGVVVTIVVLFFAFVLLPWNCRRRVHYNSAYRGKVEKQIKDSEIVKQLEKRVEALEKAFPVKP